MEIPYNEWDLRIALISLDENKLTEEKFKELGTELAEKISANGKDLNTKIAEYHGISVEALIKSPNYEILCEEYKERVIREFANKIMEKLEITEKQAWALIAVAFGLLEI